MKNIGTKPISTEKLYLRRFKSDDAITMFNNWCNDEEVTRYLSWTKHNTIKETTIILNIWLDAYETSHTYRWLITDRVTEEAMGSIDCVKFDEELMMCDIGYCIGSKYYNKGIMTEALRAVIKYLFEEVGINRITARHIKENIASGKVMEKAGMKKEGILRQSFKTRNNDLGDMIHYAILREEYYQEKKNI